MDRKALGPWSVRREEWTLSSGFYSAWDCGPWNGHSVSSHGSHHIPECDFPWVTSYSRVWLPTGHPIFQSMTSPWWHHIPECDFPLVTPYSRVWLPTGHTIFQSVTSHWSHLSQSCLEVCFWGWNETSSRWQMESNHCAHLLNHFILTAIIGRCVLLIHPANK